MGFESTIIVDNDHLLEIEKDSEFGAKTVRAIGELSIPAEYRGHEFPRISSGGCSSAAVVVESHHTSVESLVVISGSPLVLSPSILPHTKDTTEPLEVRYLRTLANQLGYSIHKKPQR